MRIRMEDRCISCGIPKKHAEKLVVIPNGDLICDDCVKNAFKKIYGAFDSENYYSMPTYSKGAYQYLMDTDAQLEKVYGAASEALASSKYDLGFWFMHNLELSMSIDYLNKAINLNPDNKEYKALRKRLKNFINELLGLFDTHIDLNDTDESDGKLEEEKLKSINESINQYSDGKKTEVFHMFSLIGLSDCINQERETFELNGSNLKKLVVQLKPLRKEK